MGDGYSIAWRILDAQYWGVPQRRRRVYLVADFGGESAPKILFERKGVSWNPSEGRNQGKDAAGSSTDSTGEASRNRERNCIAVENHSNDSRVQISPDGMVQTLTSRMGTGGGNVPLLMKSKAPQAFGIGSYHSRGMLSDNPDVGYYEAETSRTIDTSGGDPTRHQGGIAVVTFEPGAASRVGGHVYEDGKTGSLRARAGDNQQAVAIPIEGNGARPSHFGAGFSESDKMYTLNATEQHAVAYAMNGFRGDYKESDIASTLKQRDYKDATDLICENTQADVTYIVRRLTPLECCRLQGFPDDWTDGIVQKDIGKGELQFWMDVWLEHWAVVGRGNGIKRPKNEKAVRRWLANEASDSDQYKLWGNGIALPCAYFVFQGIKEVLDGSTV